jgi:hypothetical protein
VAASIPLEKLKPRRPLHTRMEILSYHENMPEKVRVWLVLIKSDGEKIQARCQWNIKNPTLWACTGSRQLRWHEASALLTLCGYASYDVRKLLSIEEFGTFDSTFEAWPALDVTPPIALSTSLTGKVNRASLLSVSNPDRTQ